MPITSHVPQKMADKPTYNNLPLAYTGVLSQLLHSFAVRPLRPLVLYQNIATSTLVDSSGG